MPSLAVPSLAFVKFAALWIAATLGACVAQHPLEAALAAGGLSLLIISLQVNQP